MVTSLAICVKQKWELSVKRACLPPMVVQVTPKQRNPKSPASSNASTMCKSYNQSIVVCSILKFSSKQMTISFLPRKILFLTHFLTFSTYFTVRNTQRVSARPSTRLHSLAWSRVWTVEALTTNAKVCSKTSPIAKTDHFKKGWGTHRVSLFTN